MTGSSPSWGSGPAHAGPDAPAPAGGSVHAHVAMIDTGEDPGQVDMDRMLELDELNRREEL